MCNSGKTFLTDNCYPFPTGCLGGTMTQKTTSTTSDGNIDDFDCDLC